VDQIVDDDDIIEISILYDLQILDLQALLGLKTMISAQNPLDRLSLGVEMGDNCLSVIFSRCSESIYFEEMTDPLQKQKTIRPHIEPNTLFSFLHQKICLLSTPNSMDKCLIKIEHQKLLLTVLIGKNLPFVSGNVTLFRRRYSSEGPFSEQTE